MPTSISGIFTNCIIEFYYTYIYASNFRYCLYANYIDSIDAASVIDGTCWGVQQGVLDDNCNIKNSDVSQYKGSNGEQIGIYDASCPFTLTPRVPKATSNAIIVNNNKLTVNITVTQE